MKKLGAKKKRKKKRGSLLRIGASPHRSDKLGHFRQSMSCGAWIEHIIPSEVSFGPFAEHAGLVLCSVQLAHQKTLQNQNT